MNQWHFTDVCWNWTLPQEWLSLALMLENYVSNLGSGIKCCSQTLNEQYCLYMKSIHWKLKCFVWINNSNTSYVLLHKIYQPPCYPKVNWIIQSTPRQSQDVSVGFEIKLQGHISWWPRHVSSYFHLCWGGCLYFMHFHNVTNKSTWPEKHDEDLGSLFSIVIYFVPRYLGVI